MEEGAKRGQAADESPQREQGSEKSNRLSIDDIAGAGGWEFTPYGPQDAARNHIDAAFLKLEHLRFKVRFNRRRESI
jgi:hypothetical protein